MEGLTPALDPTFIGEAIDIVGASNVLRDEDVVAGFCSDWTGRFIGRASAVVRPGSTGEVEALVASCRRHGVALALQGGNTSLSGGTVPLRGEVVCSLRRLTDLDVDRVAGQASVGAGVVLADLQEAASRAGWAYGVDMASRGSATIGGNVATNAGGIRVLRYGDTRAQLLGVTAVFGSGQVVSNLGGLLKDNTGYHLPGLLCGSEGTLGVVTAARLRLVPTAPERVVALIGFGSARQAIEAASAVRRRLPPVSAIELFLESGMTLVREHTGLADPFDRPFPAYLLVEASDQVDPTPVFDDALASLDGVADVAVATDPVRGANLWRYREAHTEAIATRGTPHKLDIAVPLGVLGEFIERVPGVVTSLRPTAEVWLFGHAGDGNVHVNVTGVAPDDDAVDEAVFNLAAEYGGSVSAEHGIGTAKRRFLRLSRTDSEVAVFEALKRTLDPDGVLNPSVLLER
ncbi:MAG: FAD-binding oxidoreductase [Acidimicrobiales bacterium]